MARPRDILDPATERLLIEEYKNGEGLYPLSRRYGVGWRVARRAILSAGVPVRGWQKNGRKSSCADRRDDIIATYKKVGVAKEVARLLGLPYAPVYGVVRAFKYAYRDECRNWDGKGCVVTGLERCAYHLPCGDFERRLKR